VLPPAPGAQCFRLWTLRRRPKSIDTAPCDRHRADARAHRRKSLGRRPGHGNRGCRRRDIGAARPDLAGYFAEDGSDYWLGVDGLDAALLATFDDEYRELLDESDFREDPRRLDEIMEAESELFDRIWYNRRSLSHEYDRLDAGDEDGVRDLLRIADLGRKKVEARCAEQDSVTRYWVIPVAWGTAPTRYRAVVRNSH
jgi:hypothetical protein